jgi:TorA maturation chaperone TorD
VPAPEVPDAQRLAAAERDAARADLARYVAACYYEPGPEFAEERLFDTMAAAAARVAPELAAIAARLGAAFAALPLEELLVDYTRLFLGPVQALAQPYASVWLKGDANALMQDTTLAVQALYAEGGFEIADDFRELPDHVAAELEFLYLLIHRDNEARWSGRADEVAALATLRRRFLDGHLGRWLGPFLLAVHDGAQTGFYETLAELTEAFVRLEGKRAAASN